MIAPENVMRLLPDAEPPSREALARYLETAGAACLHHLGSRPLTLVRRVEGQTFFHKGPLPPVPRSVRKLEIAKSDGSIGTRLYVEDVAGLLGLVEIGTVELHPWGACVDDIERPDRLVFDLDPDEEVAWDHLAEAATELRDFLAGRGVASWPKTTGGKGLHLVAPIERKAGWAEIRRLAKAIAEAFADRAPDRFTAIRGERARSGGRIFVDWLRNGRGASAIGALSPRARAGGLVSMPLSWNELESGVSPGQFTLAAAAERVRKGELATR